MRRLTSVFGSAAFGSVMTFTMGSLLVVSCSDSVATKKTPTVYDSGYTSPDPTYTTGTTSGYTPPTTYYDAGTTTTNGTCDRSLDLTRIQGCDKFIANARVCADNNDLSPYPFTDTRSRDVVTCNTTATCVEHCTTRCARMPSGVPDECDRCSGKADGLYCGRDLGWTTAKSTDVLVRCENGVLDTSPAPQLCNNRCETSSPQGNSRCVN